MVMPQGKMLLSLYCPTVASSQICCPGTWHSGPGSDELQTLGHRAGLHPYLLEAGSLLAGPQERPLLHDQSLGEVDLHAFSAHLSG